MPGDVDRFKDTAPTAPQAGEIFYVGSDGETTGEIEHLQQVVLEVEQLSDTQPAISIDMRKITADGYSGLQGIQVMLLDFGIPPRSVTIMADFQTSNEVQAEGYESENASSPNILTIHAPRTANEEHTLDVDERNADFSGFSLRRGNFLHLVHDGESISTRTGFLDEFDTLGVSHYGAWGHYENILKLSYEGHDLVIETSNHARALVAYGKSVGFADRHQVAEDIPEEITALLDDIGDEATREAALELHSRLTKLAIEHEVKLGEMETIEALLQHNKGLLREERQKVWGLQNELDRRKRESSSSATDSDDRSRGRMGGQSTAGKTALEQHCEVIGLNPALLDGDPAVVVMAGKAMRKVWAKKLHSDVSSSEDSEEALKEINAAVDAILERFN
jgi:hypothetical protein